MADQASTEPSEPEASGNEPTASGAPLSRRAGLTREQRRLLNTPRSPDQTLASTPIEEASPAAAPPERKIDETAAPRPKPPEKLAGKEASAADSAEAPRPSPSQVPLDQQAKSSRLIEMQHAILNIGALLLLGLTFYLGKNFDRFKYMILTRVRPAPEKIPDKFPGVAADDLVSQALVAEREGHWKDAVQRLMSAKQKDLRYGGLFLRMGKILYAHGEDESADKAFERAINFGEDVAESYQYRGFIAARQKDYPAARQYFEEATRADPLAADNYYFQAAILRLDLKPKPAIALYEDAHDCRSA